MNFSPPLEKVRLIKRYKRFLADVQNAKGDVFTIHTANTGRMLGCAEAGQFIWISDSQNPKRKYRHSWELSERDDGGLIGVNTGLANHLAKELILSEIEPTLNGYGRVRTEVPYGVERSRIDILLEDGGHLPNCYVEVKNVTAKVDDYAIFPDAVTTRGTKHLRELAEVVVQGERGVIFFCVQREDVTTFRPAIEIDPLYANTLREVVAKGVEVLAYQAQLTPESVVLVTSIPVKY